MQRRSGVKSRKAHVSIPDLVREDKDNARTALHILTKHVKTVVGEKYKTAAAYHREILQRDKENARVVAGITSLQWKIAGSCVLLCAGVVGAAKITASASLPIEWKIGLSAVFAAALCLVAMGAYGMMRRTANDLEYRKVHGKVLAELFEATTGIQKLTNAVVMKTREDLEPANPARLTRRFFITIVIAAIFSAVVTAAIIWG
jgi:hypothetical protein